MKVNMKKKVEKVQKVLKCKLNKKIKIDLILFSFKIFFF